MLEEEDGCVMKEASGNDQQQKSEGGGTNQSNSILERLKTIRLGKSKILAALSMLREREKSDKVVDRQLMVKLLSSYDSLVAQEDEYIILIKRLADAERKFIQNEVEEGSKALDDSVLQFGDGTLALAGVVQRDESPAVSNSAAKASGGDDETEDDATAAARYAREAESAARNAAVASQINDSLQRNIQLTQQKIEQLKRVYAEKLRQQSNGASKASLDLDAVKQKLGKERNSVERKQQLVDRLRRKAETKRVEAALLCSGAPDDLFSATRTRSGEAESGVDAGDSLSIERVLLLSADDSDNCSGGEQYAHRVPPLPANVGGDATSASTGLLDNNSGDAKEADSDKLSENKSTLHARISARFAAFEARKQRMRELRAQLNRVERRQMDQTYGDALHRLKNLTKMRQQLESMSATYTGGGIEDTSGNGEGEDCDDRNIDEAFAAAQARLSLKRLPDGGVDTVTVTSSAAAGLPNQISEDGASSSLKHLSASLATDESATGNAGSHFIVNNASQQNHECRDVSSSSDQAKHLEELRDQLNTESARLEKERTMECVRRTFVIGGPPIKTGERESEEGNEAAADGGSAHLERHICATVELVIKWLDDNPDIFWTPACDQHLPDTLKRQNRAHELRDLVIAEASHALLEQDAAERMEFSEQLAPYLDDILAQFFSASHDESIIAQTSHDRQRELLVFQLSEILYNELTFWRLIHSADRLIE